MGGKLSRRSFVKAAGAIGGLSLAAGGITVQKGFASEQGYPKGSKGQPVEATVDVKTGEVKVNEDVLVRYSACLGCYSSCGNRVKIDRKTGRILHVGGNPYNPACSFPYLPFETPLEKAYLSLSYANGEGNSTRGTLCQRGNASLDSYSQPDRLSTPLKRAGKRGEGKWRPISWSELIDEVVEGGKIFSELGEDTEVEGFRKVRDLDALIDEKQPMLGAKSNQLVFIGGRGDGRTIVAERFAKCFGTVNHYAHESS